jgi:trans-aconitate 2-methyltransferase
MFRAGATFRIAMDNRPASAQIPNSLVSQQSARAATDLLGRIQNIAARRIGYTEVAGYSIEPLLARRYPDAEFVTLDAPRAGRPAPASKENGFDLIFSSGDIESHPSLDRLLPMLVNRLKSGGLVALHTPNNLYEPNRALARMIAADGPWAATLLRVAKTRPSDASMEGLYALLEPICRSVEIWETTYLFALEGVEAIVEFMRPRSLAPFLTALDPRAQCQFLEHYLNELRRAYPTQSDGAVLFRFPMIFVLAAR